MTDAVFTPDELAARWKVSRDYVYALIRGGTLRTLPIPHGCKRPTYRVPADAVIAMEAGVATVEAPKSRRKRKTEQPGFIRYFSGREGA